MFIYVFLLNQKSYARGVTIVFRNEEESRDFHSAFEQWQNEDVTQGSNFRTDHAENLIAV